LPLFHYKVVFILRNKVLHHDMMEFKELLTPPPSEIIFFKLFKHLEFIDFNEVISFLNEISKICNEVNRDS